MPIVTNITENISMPMVTNISENISMPMVTQMLFNPCICLCILRFSETSILILIYFFRDVRDFSKI